MNMRKVPANPVVATPTMRQHGLPPARYAATRTPSTPSPKEGPDRTYPPSCVTGTSAMSMPATFRSTVSSDAWKTAGSSLQKRGWASSGPRVCIAYVPERTVSLYLPVASVVVVASISNASPAPPWMSIEFGPRALTPILGTGAPVMPLVTLPSTMWPGPSVISIGPLRSFRISGRIPPMVPGGPPSAPVTSSTSRPGGGVTSSITWKLLDEPRASGVQMRTVSVYTPLSLVVAVTSGPGTRPSLCGIGDARTSTPATAAPVVISVARPVIFRGTGVGLGAAVVASVALGVTVG